MDLNSVYNRARKDVVGQDDPLKKFILTVNHNLNDGHFNKQNIILKGDVGTGKTLMCDVVAREMRIPFAHVDLSLNRGVLSNEHIEEALKIFAEKLDSTDLRGIILLDGLEKLFMDSKDGSILNFAKCNNYLVANIRLNVNKLFDLSKVTLVAEGIYEKNGAGFSNRMNSVNQRLFNSRFTRIIETNPINEEFVRNAILFSNVSSLRNIGDITICDDEINKIVAMVVERGVGLHSASAVIDDVLYPKFEKKYFN
ncbi:MAG: AAA family ATPase [Bacilli bacterium]|nr:AAA family ATPase [Bacilli bacterium]